MKTALYTTLFFVGFISCKSVEKMVEKGEYDRAFNYSISKLQGEKNKKTEYVKALEKAYFKLNTSSVREIEKLDPTSKPDNWNRVLNIYKSMESRQEKLEPLLPLVSEDRYRATFEIKNYTDLIRNAEDKTCLYYYDNAITLIGRTERTGEKEYAREAYDELKKIEIYKNNYQDIEKLKDKALMLGLININIEIFNDLRDFQSNTIERELLSLPVSRLDDIWHEFKTGNEGNITPDYTILVELNNISFSPERERLNNYTESNEILIRKDKVKEKRDTADVWVEKEVWEKVRADVSEIFREKKSELHGRIILTKTNTKESLKTIPISIYHDFTGYACKFNGDERALSAGSRKKLDAYCELFPPDYVMAEDLAIAFKNTIFDEIKKMKF